MRDDFHTARRAARRAYEIGRIRSGLVRALVIACLAAPVASAVVGRRALVWLPVTLIIWAVVAWRGTWLEKGARRGLLAGVAAFLLPLSLLRPCCNAMASSAGQGCAAGLSGPCVAVGALFGLSLALLIPRAPDDRRAEAAVGVALGAASLAVLRCAPLLLGEALGLLGGLVAGVAAAGFAHAWAGRRRTA